MGVEEIEEGFEEEMNGYGSVGLEEEEKEDIGENKDGIEDMNVGKNDNKTVQSLVEIETLLPIQNESSEQIINQPKITEIKIPQNITKEPLKPKNITSTPPSFESLLKPPPPLPQNTTSRLTEQAYLYKSASSLYCLPSYKICGSPSLNSTYPY